MALLYRNLGLRPHEVHRLDTFDLNLSFLVAKQMEEDFLAMTRRINAGGGMVFPTVPLR